MGCANLCGVDYLLPFANEDSGGNLIDEAFAEITGESKRKWAFLVVALLLSASVAVGLIRLKAARAQREADIHEPETTGVAN